MVYLTIITFLSIFFVCSAGFSDVKSESKTVRFYNAKILLNHQLISQDLWISQGKIVSPQPSADLNIDAQGAIISPGYIDVQINGGFGIDFSVTPEDVNTVAQQLPHYGVTSFLPTIVSSSPEKYRRIIPLLQPTPGIPKGANILGIHLEGPLFNPKFLGAHESIFFSTSSLYDIYGDLEGVKMITLAPEIPGALEAIAYLKSKNIVVAAGHTNATYDEMRTGIEAGVSCATHLFNAMTPFHHRMPGVAGAVLLNDNIYYTLIVDGVHLHPATVEIVWRCHPEGLILVSDAMEALGLPSGKYHLGTKEVDVLDRVAYVSGTKTIAGSVVSMDVAVRNLRSCTNCSLVQALEAATLRPAQLLGIEETKGSLEIGSDADFILLDDELNVKACYIAGELIWD